jgi:hypothetical protein
MNQNPLSNGNGTGDAWEWPDPIVVSPPDSAFEVVMIPLSDEQKKALTVNVDYLKPPRPQRPANLRWWERLAWAWRGL